MEDLFGNVFSWFDRTFGPPGDKGEVGKEAGKVFGKTVSTVAPIVTALMEEGGQVKKPITMSPLTTHALIGMPNPYALGTNNRKIDYPSNMARVYNEVAPYMNATAKADMMSMGKYEMGGVVAHKKTHKKTNKKTTTKKPKKMMK